MDERPVHAIGQGPTAHEPRCSGKAFWVRGPRPRTSQGGYRVRRPQSRQSARLRAVRVRLGFWAGSRGRVTGPCGQDGRYGDLPTPFLGGKKGPPLVGFRVFLRAAGPRLVADVHHGEVIGRTPAHKKVDFGFLLEILLGVVRLKGNLPEIGGLAVHRRVEETSCNEVHMELPVPLLQNRRRGPSGAFIPITR